MELPEAVELSKENIEPLNQGRNASLLSAALQSQTDTTILQNLVKKRQEYELLLRTYDGDDPLGIWYEYVEWVEQSYPKHGKEGNLVTLLQNCLTRFKDSVEYFQDVRLVKLWIKYLKMVENPLELFNQLLCHGIGSQCAIFYKAWAYKLFENEDFKQADKVLLGGISRYAEPIDELKRAHQNFQIAVARRILDKSSAENAAEEERKVGNVLTTFGKKHKVPSVRVGERVKLGGPGTLHSRENLAPRRNVDPVNVFEAENDPELASSVNKMQTVPHLEVLKKENTKKPTPWSGVKHKSTYKFHPPKPTFQVLGDENVQSEPLNSVVFLNALKPKKKDDGFHCPVAVFELPNPNQKPMYPKDQVYAGGTEYSLEELKAVKYMKHKEKRNRELLFPGSSKVGSDCSLEDRKLPEQSSVATNQYQHCVEHPKCTDSAANHLAENDNLCVFGSPSDVTTPVEQCVVDGNYITENIKCTNIFSSLNKEEIPCSENADIALPCNEPSLCRPSLLLAENEQQKVNNEGTFPVKRSGFSVFTAADDDDDDVGALETVEAGDFFNFLNKEEIPCSENAGTVLPCNESSSCRPSLLLAENEQQKVNNQGTFPVKRSCISVFTAADDDDDDDDDDDVGAPETVEAGDFFTSLNKEEIPCSENPGTVLPFNEFPIFNDEENCVVEGQVELSQTEQENGSLSVPNSNKNLFSHSVLYGPNNQLKDNVRPFSSTTKKNKIAPFQLFIDDGQGPEHNEPCETKRALFKNVGHEPSSKLCDTGSKENVALCSAFVPSYWPVTVKREKKVCDNVVTASMLKLKPKKPAEQMKESVVEECERVTPATTAAKKPEGCVFSSISASSEEVLKVINECWTSPPKNKKDAEPGLSSEFHKQPKDQDFDYSLPVKMSIGLKGETGLFPKNKENAIPQCTERGILEPANTSVQNDVLLGGQLGEPRDLDESCCTLLFNKTLISSTPNRISRGPSSSDSSDTSPPDMQEFKIPRRCAPLPTARFSIIPRPDYVLSVIMESSKENKSQSSLGSSSGGKAAHHTASNLVSSESENINCTLEIQPPSHAYL